jgi:hypothetical protein
MSEVMEKAADEMVTVRASLIESFMTAEFNRGLQQGIERGKSEATALDISDDYGTRSAVHIIQAKTRRALSKAVAERNSRRDGDNPGQAFLWTCKLLRAVRNSDGTWQGICISSTYFDV